jgi:acyl-CoA thioester hydrolase
MWTATVTPRVGDTDFLGHINNIVPAQWFELGRNPLFRLFNSDTNQSSEAWPLIMAHADYDFVAQLFFQYEVEIRTYVSKIGTKSFTVSHEAWQQGQLCVKGTAIIVYYDFKAKQSLAIPNEIRAKLEKYGQ